MTNSCVHDEIIDAKGLGTCKKCGQQRQYNMERPMEPPIIVKEGSLDGNGHKPFVVTADQVKNGEAPFSVQDLQRAKAAGVNLEIKPKKDLKRRRHYPSGKLKKEPCPFCPGKFDPRGLHNHIDNAHPEEAMKRKGKKVGH